MSPNECVFPQVDTWGQVHCWLEHHRYKPPGCIYHLVLRIVVLFLKSCVLPKCRKQQKVQTGKEPFASNWSFFEWAISCPPLRTHRCIAAAGTLPGLVCQNRRRRAALGVETQGVVAIIMTLELA
jgi:hypothetical protein